MGDRARADRRPRPCDDRLPRSSGSGHRRLRACLWLACVVWLWVGCRPSSEPPRGLRIVGIVSNRGAAETATGVAQFLEDHPEHRVAFRTPDQLAELSDPEVSGLWGDANALLLLSVHGEVVERLHRLLAEHPPDPRTTVLALTGDPRLTPSSRLAGRPVFDGLADEAFERITHDLAAQEDPAASRRALQEAFPAQAPWLEAAAYRDARGPENVAGLLAWVAAHTDPTASTEVPPPRVQDPVRFRIGGAPRTADQLGAADRDGAIAILDYDSGDRAGDRDVHDRLCAALEHRDLACVSVFARWGEASVSALAALGRVRGLSSIVVLQDFVVGGGEGRQAATERLEALGVPVLKGIRLPGRDRESWRLSEDGIPWREVHNRVAMSEVQGQGQPHVIAVAGPPHDDPATGLRLVGVEPVDAEIERLADRLVRWRRLQTLPNADKRVALVYYNHPPGRHNIGADNLDVPATLAEILGRLAAAGYDVGDLPTTAEALLDQLQERAINLPDDARYLRRQHDAGLVLPGPRYREWFDTLSPAVRAEVVGGPLSRLRTSVDGLLAAERPDLARQRVEAALGDTRHLIEGVDHRARERALDLLGQLASAYEATLSGAASGWTQVDELTDALTDTGIEGLDGWGPPPGSVLAWDGDLLIPGLQSGHVFVGPQPPRGWEVNEELLHANLTFPPHHQYLGWYHFVRDVFAADVVVHIGRHSTAEFLPGKRVGLGADDFPQLVLGDLPNVYIYIVDGVGEGIQAKRRGQAVIVDHLTPALSTTPLYDRLLELRQLVESHESSQSGQRDRGPRRAIDRIRALIEESDLREELAASMAPELEVRGITYDQVDDELLVHEVGHYLTHLQERFMPLGLHVFGRDWSEAQIGTMLVSMFGEAPVPPDVRARLTDSPAAEARAFLDGLAGRFVAPGKGNDPIRTPEVLPTGRNFHALGGEELPTRLAWDLGRQLARETLASPSRSDDAEAVILWASDTVRDEGAMIAFSLAMLGVTPQWNSRGILGGLERTEGPLPGGGRRDVTWVTSGLFRDLYGNQLVWLDKAWLLALDASSRAIASEHPQLREALAAALERLDPQLRDPGTEPLETNEVARRWLRDTLEAIADGEAPSPAGTRSSWRVFGNAAGGYGAGLNRLVERSGAWQDRSELAQAWTHRMGHAYGADVDGVPAHGAFDRRLSHIGRTHLGRASNLYGLLDNNDAFDYQGGLSLAVEHARGAPPQNRIISHADPKHPRMAALDVELLAELRGRELNPTWIRALMEHGYAGARTMGNEFLENLWGWQVSNPDIVRPWVWEEVKRVYIDDGYDLDLDAFLDREHNLHVKTNMLAILLVAADRGYYRPAPEVLAALARQFAERVVAHGLPGSGHTRPDHPIMATVGTHLEGELAEAFAGVLERTQVPAAPDRSTPSTIAEIEPDAPQPPPDHRSWSWIVAAGVVFGLAAWGLVRGARHA